MRFYFNIVQGEFQLADYEGSEFDNDGIAAIEARLVVREIIGRALTAGKVVDWASVMEVARADGAVVTAFSFVEALDLPQDTEASRPLKSQPRSLA